MKREKQPSKALSQPLVRDKATFNGGKDILPPVKPDWLVEIENEQKAVPQPKPLMSTKTAILGMFGITGIALLFSSLFPPAMLAASIGIGAVFIATVGMKWLCPLTNTKSCKPMSRRQNAEASKYLQALDRYNRQQK